jgi:hypothetical protein
MARVAAYLDNTPATGRGSIVVAICCGGRPAN